MANDSVATCPAHMRYDGFHMYWMPPGTQLPKHGLADTVVVAKGDALVFSSGGLALATDGGATGDNFAGVAAEGGGSATASANATTKIQVYPPDSNILYWAKIEDGTAEVANVGTILDFSSEDGLDETDTTEGGVGFKVKKIDTTNGYALGSFVALA